MRAFGPRGPLAMHDTELIAWLVSGREQGFLGPMPIDDQIRHALGMAGALPTAPLRVVDLGSGGGIPGLVLARLVWPTAHWHFIEANARRAAFLGEATVELGLEERITVRHGRAEEAGRDVTLRHSFDTVIARSFGPPAVTAECAAPLLIEGGAVLVSEPPADRTAQRWPADGLAALDLTVEAWQTEPVHVVLLRSRGRCADRYPRRVGIPAKRPLF